jgi:hypothetical protein
MVFRAFSLFFIFLTAAFSVIVNHKYSFEPIYGLRLLVRFYIFFLALVNLSLTYTEIKRINKFIVFIFIIQIPVATIKLFIYGPGERAIGTYSLTEGSLSTIIPLIAIGYLIAFYIYYNKNFIYLLLSLGYIYFSIICKKRALVFMLPFLISFLSVMFLVEKNYNLNLKKMLKRRILIIAPLLILIAFYFSIRLVPALNPEGKIGGTFDLKYSAHVFVEYFTREPDDSGYTTSRFSTTKRVFAVLYEKGFARFFFGYGPGAYTKSRFIIKGEERIAYKELRITYGVTPLSYIAIEYGVLGIFTYFLFIFAIFAKTIKYWKIAESPYWKAFSFGSVGFSFSMILLWLTYHIPSFTGDPIPCLYFYCMAIVYLKHRQYNENINS